MTLARRHTPLVALLVAVLSHISSAYAQKASSSESIEADVSTRRVAIQSDFSGVRIVLFGAVENSRQTAPEDGLYDIAVVIEGPREELMVRRKSHVAGIWVNTDAKPFKAVPSYYAIISTRPVTEIARPQLLKWLGIGFDQIKMLPAGKFAQGEEIKYRDSIVRIKEKQGLYRRSEVGVSFIGRSLFRATIDLPANVSVGVFRARVHLFREGSYQSSYTTELNLQRQGLERFIHMSAFEYPFLYGVVAVILAVLAGLTATTVFRRD